MVAECDDAHVDASVDGADAGLEDQGAVDTGEPDLGQTDLGGMDLGEIDVGSLDMGGPDMGPMGCANAPYCITALSPDQNEINVRTQASFTPQVMNPGGVALNYWVEEAELSTSRKPGRPELFLSDIELTYVADPSTGQVTLMVIDVPTWFMTTTFKVRLNAQGPNAKDPIVFAEAEVTVRGNVLVSGSSAVYAIASDGLPATSLNFNNGELIRGTSFVSDPKGIVLSSDGSLLVYSDDSSPPKVSRFEISGENVQLGDFDTMDGNGQPLLTSDGGGVGIVELSDGTVALIDYQFSRQTETRLVLWSPDGSYLRTLSPAPSTRWSGLTTDGGPGIIVAEQESAGRVIRIDPITGAVMEVIATDISGIWGIRWAPDGHIYVGMTGSMLRITPQGGKQMIGMLPTTSFSWRHITPFGEEGILATRNSSSDDLNVVLIRGTRFISQFRAMDLGPVITPAGIVYAD